MSIEPAFERTEALAGAFDENNLVLFALLGMMSRLEDFERALGCSPAPRQAPGQHSASRKSSGHVSGGASATDAAAAADGVIMHAVLGLLSLRRSLLAQVAPSLEGSGTYAAPPAALTCNDDPGIRGLFR